MAGAVSLAGGTPCENDHVMTGGVRDSLVTTSLLWRVIVVCSVSVDLTVLVVVGSSTGEPTLLCQQAIRTG